MVSPYISPSPHNDEENVSPSQIPEAPFIANNPTGQQPFMVNNPGQQPFIGGTPVESASPYATASSQTPKPHRQYNFLDNDDPLKLAEQKRASKETEEKREPPSHSGKGWRRYYDK